MASAVPAPGSHATHEAVPSSPPVSIPDAGEIGKACAALLDPADFEPHIRKFTEEVYERLLWIVQDYIKENSEFGIADRIRAEEERSNKYWRDLLAIDVLVGVGRGDRMSVIGQMVSRARRYDELIYAVSQKHDGETRHETVLRYILEREAGAAQAMSAGTAETQQAAQGDSPPARSEGCAQSSPPLPPAPDKEALP